MTTSLRADDIKLRDGTILKSAKITSNDGAAATIIHESGIAHVMISDLPAELRAVAAQKSPVADPAVFFLTQRVSFTGAGGVVGYPPGTEVHLVSEAAGDATVAIEGQSTIVPRSQLTNDLGIARALTSRDAGAQARIASLLKEDRAADAQRQGEEAAKLAERNRLADAQRKSGDVEWSNSLNQGAHSQKDPCPRRDESSLKGGDLARCALPVVLRSRI